MFDKTKALDVFAISEETFDELLKEFIVQADAKTNAIGTALDRNDIEAAARELHSFKGVAGNMRLDDCYHAVIAVELALSNKDCAEAVRMTVVLRSCVNEIRGSIKTQKD
jgi:HPt (histidine-containing phosphotransfer) domain-containing protein